MLLLAGHFKTEIFTTSKDEIPPTPNSVVSGGDSSEDLEWVCDFSIMTSMIV